MIHNWLKYRRHIERSPLIQAGEPCIAGTRMPTRSVHAWGSYEAFMDAYRREYEREAVEAALWYESLPHRRFQRWWDEHGFSIVWNRDREW